MLSFDEYQNLTARTAIYPGQKETIGLCYVGLGLGEVGEIQGKIKKVLRDDNGIVTPEKQKQLAAEIGDALWYISQLCTELHLDLDGVAQGNLEKLADRQNRGVLKGEGDTR